MTKAMRVLTAIVAFSVFAPAQTNTDSSFKLALPEHRGQLSWSADRFKVIESSVKPGGREMGLRGKDQSGRLIFLGFLFLFPEQAPLTSVKCRDGVIEPTKKDSPTLKILATSERNSPGSLPVSIVTYTAQKANGKSLFSVRGFVATGDICGDLEVYSDSPINSDDVVVEKIFESFRLDESYSPQFSDVLLYAQLLYKAHMYNAAGPVFENALVKIKENPNMAATMMKDTTTARRVITDQAGMSYGMSGDIKKSRRLFEKAIAEDPDYPLDYYNLACADAEEKNLAGARDHLQQAFARKANVIAGETMPDPTKDDSFLPYRGNKDFWKFLEGLRTKQ